MSSLADAVGALLGRVAHVEGPAAALLARLLVMFATAVLAVVAYRAATHLVDRLLRPLDGAADQPARAQRAHTLGQLMKNLARYTLAFVAVVIMLREFGVDVGALLVSAGVLGLAVGLRVTKLRMLNGAQRIVPNGELTHFVNHNKGWARAVIDVNVGYETDVSYALSVLERVGQEWAAQTRLALDAPAAQGIIRFGDCDLGLRLMVKVEAARRFDVEADLRRRIKEAFERGGIPFPQRVVYLEKKAAS